MIFRYSITANINDFVIKIFLTIKYLKIILLNSSEVKPEKNALL